jgi:3-oxosteroid 1-dehydrogenase
MVIPMSMGRSLVAQLLKICKEHNNVVIWTKSELQELVYSEPSNKVVGARIQCEHSESPVDIHASLGVVLTTGGFSKSQEMRNSYLRITPTEATTTKVSSKAEWSLAAPGDVGAALRVGQQLGADTAQLGQVWGIPTMIDPATGELREAMFAISKPFSFVVDAYGCRFFSESQPYGTAVKSMYKRARENAEAAVFWLILDSRYMHRYPIGGLKDEESINQAVSHGFLFHSDTIGGLAHQILHPDNNLQGTTDEWNEMCKNGKDKHFQRGEDRYQQFTGDPDLAPNPCMGPVKDGPFYAMMIFPGDAGTRGGLFD